MSNYLKNVLAFARPTTSAPAVALSSSKKNGDSRSLFYPSSQPEQQKKDRGSKSPRQLSSDAKQRLSYPIPQSQPYNSIHNYPSYLEENTNDRLMFHPQMTTFSPSMPVNTSQINKNAQPYFYITPQASAQQARPMHPTPPKMAGDAYKFNPQASAFKSRFAPQMPHRETIQSQNQRSSQNDPTKKYFQSELEAQEWEEEMDYIEAPAPVQYLEDCGDRTRKHSNGQRVKKVKQVKSSGVKGKQQVGDADEAQAAMATKPVEGFQKKFKTEICKFWQLTGTCEYEDACSFAHGRDELKQKPDLHKNYKTKQCKRFFKDLYCPYGPRCQFLHDEPAALEAKKNKKAAQEKEKAQAAAIVDFGAGLHIVENQATKQTAPAPVERKENVRKSKVDEEAAAVDFSYAQLLNDVAALDMQGSLLNEGAKRRLRCFEDIPLSSSRSASQSSQTSLV